MVFLWCYLNLNKGLKLSLKAGYSSTFKAKVGGVIYDYPGEQENGALISVIGLAKNTHDAEQYRTIEFLTVLDKSNGCLPSQVMTNGFLRFTSE